MKTNDKTQVVIIPVSGMAGYLSVTGIFGPKKTQKKDLYRLVKQAIQAGRAKKVVENRRCVIYHINW